MAEKAKNKLSELQLKWVSPKSNAVISPDHIIRIFQNNSEKLVQEKQNGILATLIKPHVTNYDDIKKQYDYDTHKNKKTPYEAFVKLVNNAVFSPVAGQKPQVPVKPTKHDFDSPTLSSTRVETSKRRSDVNVSEVLKFIWITFAILSDLPLYIIFLDQRETCPGNSNCEYPISNIPSSITQLVIWQYQISPKCFLYTERCNLLVELFVRR